MISISIPGQIYPSLISRPSGARCSTAWNLLHVQYTSQSGTFKSLSFIARIWGNLPKKSASIAKIYCDPRTFLQATTIQAQLEIFDPIRQLSKVLRPTFPISIPSEADTSPLPSTPIIKPPDKISPKHPIKPLKCFNGP